MKSSIHPAPARRSQEGFITLMSLIILSFIISLANAYLLAGSKEVDISRVLLAADQARQAAHAGVRLSAGLLVQDAVSASATDHHGENWFLVTENTSGTNVPYALDSTKGVYFNVMVVDLSGRGKANATTDASTQTLIDRLPYYGSSIGSVIVAGNYWTVSEFAMVNGLGNDRVTGLTPYGTDFRINLNTLDIRDDINTTDPPDISQILLKAQGGIASSNANTYSRKLLRSRRGGAGQDNNSVYNPSAKDYNPAVVFSTTGAWLTMAQSFSSPATNSVSQGAINSAAVNYGRVNSEGFFLIKCLGWVVKDPAAGSGGTRRAQYQVMRYIRRTSTGYQDCANREWYVETRDVPIPPYTNADYDWNNTFFIIDSNF